MNSISQNTIQEFKRTWGGRPIEESLLLQVVEYLQSTKLRGNKLHDYLTDTYNISDGAALELIKLTKENQKAAYAQSRSAEEARIDRILRTRNSDGKATARKFR